MKKFLKTLKLISLAFISIIIIVILYIFISSKLFIGSKNTDNISYLKQNSTVIENKFDDKVFDKNFTSSSIFLLGEIHGFAANQELDEFMIKYLNKNLDVRFYIAEIDSVNANKLNVFLDSSTKNEKLLGEVVSAIKKRIPQQSSKELFRKWNNIYDYNQQLQSTKKIKVIGIDTNFDETNSKISRDSAMLLNFNQYVSKNNLQKEKFYGLFGFYHVMQKSFEKGKKPFAERLVENGNKVTSIASYTLNSEMYLPKNDQFPTPENEKINWLNADGPMMQVKGINDFNEVSSPNSITLFNLNKADSPYKNSKNLINVKSLLFGENLTSKDRFVTTDYFQYAVILRNSKALTSFK